MKTKQDRLNEILSTMDVPKFRKKDLHWLDRNVWIWNGNHPDIKECCELINDLLFKKAYALANYALHFGSK
jgi:hypothetical protein